MEHENFIQRYNLALASQNWQKVEPLMGENITVTFSNGQLFKGKTAVKGAFEKNFATIENEKYVIENVHWILKNPLTAVYTFDFKWAGLINGEPAQGSGGGTAVIINENGSWRLLTEHLCSRPRV